MTRTTDLNNLAERVDALAIEQVEVALAQVVASLAFEPIELADRLFRISAALKSRAGQEEQT